MDKTKIHAYQKKLRDERRANKLCIDCGTKLDELYKFVTCDVCRNKRRISANKYNHSKNGKLKNEIKFTRYKTESEKTSTCTQCRKAPREYGKLCLACRTQNMNKYAERKKTGMCVSCGKKAITGLVHCKACNIRKYKVHLRSVRRRRRSNVRLYQRERYAQRKLEGLCTKCGAAVLEVSKSGQKYSLCSTCRQKNKDLRENLKSLGICPNCRSNPSVSKWIVSCAECLEKHALRNSKELTRNQKNKHNERARNRRKERKVLHICSTCGRPTEWNSDANRYYIRCLRCRVKSRKYKFAGVTADIF